MGSSTSPLAGGRSILETRALSTVTPTPLQAQVDGVVGSFTQQATDWRALAAMTVGGMAFRAGRVGIMGLGNAPGLSALSVGGGLAAEVSAFELTHRGLQSLGPQGHAPLNTNLWRWNGSGGLREGLLHSFVTFGTLKAGGRAAQGQNAVVQHLLQDTAMVLGHQASGALHITPRPTGSLAEQFLHAEATTLQIGAGMALVHRMTPGAVALERGLDLSLRANPSFSIPSIENRTGLRFAEASTGRETASPAEATREERLDTHILMMSSNNDSKGPPSVPIRHTPPRRSISNVFRQILGLSGQEDMREILVMLHSSLTGPAQRMILDTLQDLESGRPVSPMIEKILKDSRVRSAAFLSPQIQRDIEKRLEVLANVEGAPSEPPGSTNRNRPTLLGFKRMVAEEGVSAQDLAKILNRLNFPQIDLSSYASYRDEPIYISGEEDASLLQRYAKLDYQSFGEVLFFARRDLARNLNRAEAADLLKISVEELARLEENQARPSAEQIDRIVQTYPIHRGLLEKIIQDTRYGDVVIEEEGPPAPETATTPVSGPHSLPFPNLSTETIYDLNAQRLQNMARMVQNTESLWPFSATEGVHEALGLALYFEGIVRKIKQDAVRDHLTGMLNRTGLNDIAPRLEARLKSEHRRYNDNGRTDWVLMIDIDHFKRVNDNFGHQNGDKVLSEAARTIRDQLGRLHDLAARFGGEEFFVWLGSSDEQGAVRVAEAIRTQVEAQAIQINGFDPLHVTVSIGLAEMQPLAHPEKPGEFVTEGSLENAIERADKALYAAKRSGRNRAILYHDTLGKIAEGEPNLFNQNPDR